MKIIYILLSVLAISAANAYDNNCCEPCQLPPKCECDPCECNPCEPCAPCCEVPGEPTTAAYNQSAAIDVCGCMNFYASATFLWIQPIQEQMEFAVAIDTGAMHFHKMDFEWKPAFKLGLGYIFTYDKWDCFLEYTRIKSEINDNAKIGNHFSLNPTWFVALAGPVVEVKNKWNLDFNTFDLNLGRIFYNGTKLSCRCHYGLKAGWIDQKIQIEVISPDRSTSSNTFKSDSWLIGPRVGFASSWYLGEGFRLFGDGAASIFYRKIQHHHKHSLAFIENAFEAIVGLGYGTYFNRNNWHFDLMAGYEAQLFFNQNGPRFVEELIISHITKPGNLMFHGLNITARLDF